MVLDQQGEIRITRLVDLHLQAIGESEGQRAPAYELFYLDYKQRIDVKHLRDMKPMLDHF